MGYYYYWEDHCDAYPNGWVCSSPCPWSLDTTNQIEGSGCFKGNYAIPSVATSLIKAISPSVSLPNPFHFYFWVKVVSSHTSNNITIMAKLTSGYVGVRIIYITGSNFTIAIKNGAGTGSYVQASLNAWHLIELKVEQVSGNVVVNMWIDDVYKNFKSHPWTFGNLNEMFMFDDFGAFERYVDWIRIGISIADITGDEGSVALKSVVGDCCGITSLHNVLNWHEEEEAPIPIKRIVRKESPTVQAEYFVRLPRRITLELKSSKSEKVVLEACKHCHDWVDLFDYDGSLVDSVWIEGLHYRWAGDVDHNSPWHGRMSLVCSST